MPKNRKGESPNPRDVLRDELRHLRAEYLREREGATDGEYSAMREFDKAMLTLSAGSLGFSLSLLPLMDGEVEVFSILWSSWIFFGAAILSTVVSLFMSHLAFRKQRILIQSSYRTNLLRYKDAYKKWATVDLPAVAEAKVRRIWETKWVRGLNFCSIISFTTALVLLVTFATINLKETAMSDKETADVPVESTETTTLPGPDETAGLEPAEPPDPPPIVLPEESGDLTGGGGAGSE